LVANDIIIHVGLPKTGTTFLQNGFFPKIKNAKVFGVGNIPFYPDTKLWENKINIISNERLFGEPNTPIEKEHRNEIARRLHGAFPNAKIIVVFRERKSWTKSLYGEYVRNGGTEVYDIWYDKIFEHDSLDFESYEKCLRDLFDDVLVLQFEDLKTRPDYFVKKTCEFINVEVPEYENTMVNIRLDDKLIKRWRMMNKIFNSRYSPDNKGVFSEYLNPLRYYTKIMRMKGK
jgi:hypothetical protein